MKYVTLFQINLFFSLCFFGQLWLSYSNIQLFLLMIPATALILVSDACHFTQKSRCGHFTIADNWEKNLWRPLRITAECVWPSTVPSDIAGLRHTGVLREWAAFLPLKINQGRWALLIIYGGLFYTYCPRKRHQDGFQNPLEPDLEGVGNRKWKDGWVTVMEELCKQTKKQKTLVTSTEIWFYRPNRHQCSIH